MNRSCLIVLFFLFFAFIYFSLSSHLVPGDAPVKEKPVHQTFSIAKPDARIPENNLRIFVICFNCISLELKRHFESALAKTPQLFNNFGAAKIQVFLPHRFSSLLGYHFKVHIQTNSDSDPLVA